MWPFNCPLLSGFALCFETPLPSSSPGWSICEGSTTLSGGSDYLPTLSPGDTAPLSATPMFQTPPTSGPPPPYVQPKAQIRSTTSSNGDHAHPLPSIRPTLDPGSQNVPSHPCTPTNQRVPPGSSVSTSSSGSSFLTPGNFYSTHAMQWEILAGVKFCRIAISWYFAPCRSPCGDHIHSTSAHGHQV